MKLEKIEALVHLLEASSLTAIEVQNGMDRVRLERNVMLSEMSAAPTPAPRPMATPEVPAGPSESQNQIKTPSAPVTGGIEVKSPMVGVFYAAPSPDSEPYVTVGSQVKKGDVLCIIEAMKLMNEITAEADGEITEICVHNGDIVEYGQMLFRIK